MNRMHGLKIGAASLAAAVLLAACGGSDAPSAPVGDGLTQMQREDRDASASVAGLFAFAVSLVSSMTSETSEPRAINGITPPVAEDAEPSVIPL
jgi:hypothetical protein